MTPRAGTGTRLGLYLKEMCTTGSPRNVVWDLYSNPQPSHLAFAGNGAPQLGQDAACSEISCRHSLQGFISSALSPCCWDKVALSRPEDTHKATGPEEEMGIRPARAPPPHSSFAPPTLTGATNRAGLKAASSKSAAQFN